MNDQTRPELEQLPEWIAVVGSTLALAAAFILTTAMHELAHAIAAGIFGLDPVWHGVTTLHVAGTAAQETVVALAGPAFSLISGTIVLALPRRIRAYPGLLLTWLGLLSVAGFFGYLISGAFAPSGDIADALRLQHTPPRASWLILMFGVVGLLLVARIAAIRLVAHAPSDWSTSKALRRIGLAAIVGAAPLLLAGGIPIGPPLIAQLVIIALVVLLGWAFRSYSRPGSRAEPPSVPVALSVFIALGLLEWLALRPGVHL